MNYIYKCNYCDEILKSNLRRHIENIRYEKLNDHICKYCNSFKAELLKTKQHELICNNLLNQLLRHLSPCFPFGHPFQ